MTKICPNCESEMNEGEECPECDHGDNCPDCECAYCMATMGEDEQPDRSNFDPTDFDIAHTWPIE